MTNNKITNVNFAHGVAILSDFKKIRVAALDVFSSVGVLGFKGPLD